MNNTGPLVRKTDVAVVGMAGRFPGACSIEQFWCNLREGIDSIHDFTKDELLKAGVPADIVADPSSLKSSGVLADYDSFDASFFGISPAEAELMDPQHRIFLECASSALDHAGYGKRQGPEQIGIYAGCSINGYLLNVLLRDADERPRGISLRTLIGSDKDFLTTRVAYRLDLRGPAFTVQSACSTSLVAIHLAAQSIVNGECDMALAGGVSVAVPQVSTVRYMKGSISSPSGRCRSFDAQADGIVGGSGVGIVVLKGLSEALADGDHILAVIKGSAINNDGSRKVGFNAPSQLGQARAIKAALAVAEVEPHTVGYIETHGTGTPLGDPIEVAALAEGYGEGAVGSRLIGSVKSNIGHLDAAAGVAGFIKAVLCLQHGKIPPSLHVTRPNPELKLRYTPFSINTTLSSWPIDKGPRRVAVSAFGVGGTNVHAVLEQAPEPLSRDADEGLCQLLILSAARQNALSTMADALANRLEADAAIRLEDVAYTLQHGREEMLYRRALVCDSRLAAVDALRRRAWIGETDGTLPERLERLTLSHDGEASAALTEGSATQDARRSLLTEVASRWTSGADVDWVVIDPPGRARRVTLPTYPFERRSHWAVPRKADSSAGISDNRKDPIDAQTLAPQVDVGSVREIEEALCTIWSEALQLDSVAPADNVFSLGADSLVALQVIETIEKRFGLELSPVVCYEAPSAELLAKLILECTHA